MRIAQSLIDQILDRVDLVELIGRRVQLKKSGKSFTACCPFHGEKTPSFHVHRDKGFYHCFGCQASGNALGFLMNYEHRSFRDALNELAGLAGIDLPKESDTPRRELQYPRGKLARSPSSTTRPSPAAAPTVAPPAHWPDPADPDHAVPVEPDWQLAPPPEPEWFAHAGAPLLSPEAGHLPAEEGNLYDLLENICQFYQQQLQQHPPARQYLHRRGLDGQACIDWRLGYAPDGWQHLEQAFAEDVEGLRLLGLIRSSDTGREYDLLRDRVIFPIRDRKGRVVGFGGRALSDEVKPKYINSPESVLFNKSQLLYGLYESRKARAERWLLVEGYMDVIALHQAGLPGAVAALGTASNVEHLNLLFRQSDRLTLAFDGDSAGQKAAWRTLELALPVLSDGRELRFLVLPEGHDPDSLIRAEGVKGMIQRLEAAPALSDFLFQQLSTQFDLRQPEGKAQLLDAAKPLLALLPAQGSYRQLLRQSLRERLGLVFGRQSSAQARDTALSFEQDMSLEDRLLVLLLHCPALSQQLGPVPESAWPPVLRHWQQVYGQCQAQCPEDADLALYFLLGAWPDDAERQRLCGLIERSDLWLSLLRPEQVESLCADYVLHLQLRHVQAELLRAQQSGQLASVQGLRQQWVELQRQVQFREAPADTPS